MKISQDVRDYAAEKGLAEQDALQEGLAEKSKQFLEAGAEIYREV
jgi:phosphomethylpyrimidine synthase